MKKRHIILIGFMGTGKTTVGELVAHHLSRPLVDTDHYLEKQRRTTIATIFSTEGEEQFRQQEHDTLAELVHRAKPHIITTGGGIVLRSDNVELMEQYGWVIALTATRDALIARMQQDTSRPLLSGGVAQRIDRLLAERRHAYDFAHIKVDTSERTPQQVAEVILKYYHRL